MFNRKFDISSSNYFILCCLMLIALTIPAVFTISDVLTGPDEKRKEMLAKTPKFEFNFSSMKHLPGETQHYIKERFAFKNNFISWNSYIKKYFFNSSAYSDVMFGNNDYLYSGGAEAIDFTQGISLFSDKEVSDWTSKIQNLSEKTKELGAKYAFVLAPNKHTVYKDSLPAWVVPKSSVLTRTDQLVNTNSKAPIYDLRPVFVNKSVGNIAHTYFYRTDTHWNEYGANVGVQYLLESIDIVPSVTSNIRSVKTEQSGDLARMSGMRARLDEHSWTVELDSTFKCKHTLGNEFVRNETDPLYFERIDCKNALAKNGKLLVFMDSFGVSMVPSLAAEFKEVVFVWQYNVDFNLIASLRPEYVLHQIVERKLQTLNLNDL